jgi:predicted enzyme related to lactoylglutathione lyase
VKGGEVIRGLRTVIYPVGDLAKGKAWYTKILGAEPYFDQPYYVGYAVGGFELGLIPDGVPGPQGALAYWGVSDADAEIARLTGLKAEVLEPVKDVGGGIKVASIVDPFGNVFGLIENPGFNPAAMT